MKKLFTIILLVLLCANAMAYDFSAVCSTGQTLYYNITSNEEPYTVEVVPENESDPYYTTYPTGDLEIPESVEYNSITYSVTSIGTSAFWGCNGLTSVTIPNSATSIGIAAFSGCSGLIGTLTIPNSITSIGIDAFSDCSGLISVTIPNSVTSIGHAPFSGCSELESVVVDSSNPIYDSRNNCNAIIETETNTMIAGHKNTIIPNSVTSIGDYAFYECYGLTSVTIPNSVTSICEGAFSQCNGLISVTISNSVTRIGDWAFNSCYELTSVRIGNSVAEIGNLAFNACDNITEIKIYATTPPILDNETFSETIYNSAIVYVPKGTLEIYGNDSQWGQFSDIREMTDYYWSCDFEGDEIWTFGNDTTGNVQWQIVTPETYPTNISGYFHPFVYEGDTINDTPEHWAMVELVSESEQLGGPGQVSERPWIQFDNIDLSEAAHPQLIFNQIYRRLNSVETLIRVSIDGGTTWTDHIVNEDIESNENAYSMINKGVPIFEAAGYDNVIIRFQMNGDGTALQGYGWQIDDIKITEPPAYDLTLQSARINMFGYLDYRDADYLAELWTDASVSASASQIGMTNDEFRRDNAYHYYDPYAQSPRKQWFSDKGFAAFNIEVVNNGYETIIPKARIKVFDPNGTLIYNQTGEALHSLEYQQGDTIDIAHIDNENPNSSTIFRFDVETEYEIILGRYNVEFEIFVEDDEDANPIDNFSSQYFYITDNKFSMSYDAPPQYYTYDLYTSSSSGDEYGTLFTYYYEPEKEMIVEAYIDNHTTVGTSVQAIIYEYDGNTVGNEILSSDTIIITEDMLGRWINFSLSDTFNINISDTSDHYSFLAAIRGIWDDGNTIAIGLSNILTSIGHNSYLKLVSLGDTWHWGSEQLAIRVREKREINDSTIFWSCDFEEGSPEPYITRTDESEEIWQIITEADYPDEMYTIEGSCFFLPMNYTGHEGNTDPNQQISETPEHWAFVDACSDLHESPPSVNTSMTFTNINLSDCLKPKLSFLQSWRVLNHSAETISVETSTDGGSTWTTHIINNENLELRTYVNGYKEVFILEAGGADNVYIRFNYVSNSEEAWNYGWQIDDIKIMEAPAYDLTLQDARISMFGYVDYRDEEYLNEFVTNYNSYEEQREYAYQYYDPYAQSPKQQWLTDKGFVAFNIEVVNNGYETVTPKARVKIYNPNGDLIYDQIGNALRPSECTQSDTIDIASIDEDNPTVFRFDVENENEIIAGRYNVEFHVFSDGNEDADTTDNYTSQYFYITDDKYSTSYDEPAGYFDYNHYSNSSSGDEYGSLFIYNYESDKSIIVEAYISRYCSVGVQVQAIIYDYVDGYINEGLAPAIISSDTIMVTEDMLDSWVTFTFNNVPSIKFDSIFQVSPIDSLAPRKFIVGIKGMWNDGETFALGTSDVLTSKCHNSLMRFVSDETWYMGGPQLAISVRETGQANYTINVVSSDETMGSVSGGGTYEEGTDVVITAMPNGGYLFDSWEDGIFDNPRSIAVTSDSTFVADFVKCEITQTIDTVVQNFVTVGDHTFYSTGNYSFAVLHETDCDTIFDIRLRVLAEPVYDIGPNPAKSLLNINSYGFISAVEFYSTTGQLVMRKEVNGYEAEFDVEGLMDGVYIVRIYGEESSLPSVSKIIKE